MFLAEPLLLERAPVQVALHLNPYLVARIQPPLRPLRPLVAEAASVHLTHNKVPLDHSPLPEALLPTKALDLDKRAQQPLLPRQPSQGVLDLRLLSEASQLLEVHLLLAPLHHQAVALELHLLLDQGLLSAEVLLLELLVLKQDHPCSELVHLCPMRLLLEALQDQEGPPLADLELLLNKV